ncbi:DUF5641 domain-containing protein [Trichonephila clavipes]|nr:DUF5641 domain-containing protein [Trichonephila clavipes]
MFIHGNSNCETPDLDQVDRSSLVKRTKYLQKLREDLRQRFRNEYLAHLVHRGTRRNDALKVGDVVLIGHDNVQRIDWPLGVVLEVYFGKDGVPRVARIKTSHDSLPVQKTPESSTDHVSDSPTDYVPNSPVESTDNSEEKPPTKTRLERTIKIPLVSRSDIPVKEICSSKIHDSESINKLFRHTFNARATEEKGTNAPNTQTLFEKRDQSKKKIKTNEHRILIEELD